MRANRVGIKNDRMVPLTSSGPMEKAIEVLASRRLKSRSISWPLGACDQPRDQGPLS
ncbi:MAG TPA: hypothetical protein VGS16_08065 [Candidatus Dormibacteraeota bacterium]|nr:hypothetical protein [Candidatus Dormibacteraeota bacterium]